jgi:hypothetical protein
MSYFFYGSRLKWIGYKDPGSGIADVTLDGVTTSVDLYSPAPAAQSVVYAKENLPIGFHFVTIDVTNRKNAASSGFKVWIDAIEDDPPWTAYTNEVLMIRLDGAEIRRLAHHRSRPYNSYDYMPRASVSSDGTRLIFASNYGLPVDGYTDYVDAYLMTLNSRTLRWDRSITPTAGLQAQQPRGGVATEPEPFVADILRGPRERPILFDYLYGNSRLVNNRE